MPVRAPLFLGEHHHAQPALKKLAYQFKEPNAEEVDEELELAESVADAADRVAAMRSRIDGVDELLAKLNLSNN